MLATGYWIYASLKSMLRLRFVKGSNNPENY
jgi:hypothetical protein